MRALTTRRCLLGTALPVVLALLTTLACTESDSPGPCRVGCDRGILVGGVTAGTDPVAAEVIAMRVDETGVEFLASTVADSSGRFVMELPSGGYIVSAYLPHPVRRQIYFSASGPTLEAQEADTLWIRAEGDLRWAFFPLARLRVQAAMHADYDNVPVGMMSYRHLPEGASGSGVGEQGWGNAVVRDGNLAVDSPPLLPGTYSLAMALPSGETIWLPDGHRVEDAAQVTVTAQSELPLDFTLTSPPALFEAHLTGAWMTMHTSEPRVSLFASDSTLMLRDYVDSSGACVLPLQVVEDVRVLVVNAGVERWVGGMSFEEAQVFALTPGQTTRMDEIVDCGLRVGLPGLDVGSEIQWGDVWVYDDTGTRVIGSHGISNVRESQVIPFANLDPGTYLLRVRPREFLQARWLGQWYQGALSAQDATPITLSEPGTCAEVVVELQRGASILGAVEHAGSPAQVTAWVGVTTEASPSLLGSRRAIGRDESYELRGLPDGDYRVGAWLCDEYMSCPPEDVVWFPGTTQWGEATTIAIRNGEDVTGIDIEISLAKK